MPANYPDNSFAAVDPIMLDARKNGYRDWRQQVISPAQNKALHTLHTFKGTVRVIEAEKDGQVPSQPILNFVHAVSDPAKLRYTVMSNAPHN